MTVCHWASFMERSSFQVQAGIPRHHELAISEESRSEIHQQTIAVLTATGLRCEAAVRKNDAELLLSYDTLQPSPTLRVANLRRWKCKTLSEPRYNTANDNPCKLQELRVVRTWKAKRYQNQRRTTRRAQCKKGLRLSGGTTRKRQTKPPTRRECCQAVKRSAGQTAPEFP